MNWSFVNQCLRRTETLMTTIQDRTSAQLEQIMEQAEKNAKVQQTQYNELVQKFNRVLKVVKRIQSQADSADSKPFTLDPGLQVNRLLSGQLFDIKTESEKLTKSLLSDRVRTFNQLSQAESEFMRQLRQAREVVAPLGDAAINSFNDAVQRFFERVDELKKAPRSDAMEQLKFLADETSRIIDPLLEQAFGKREKDRAEEKHEEEGSRDTKPRRVDGDDGDDIQRRIDALNRRVSDLERSSSKWRFRAGLGVGLSYGFGSGVMLTSLGALSLFKAAGSDIDNAPCRWIPET